MSTAHDATLPLPPPALPGLLVPVMSAGAGFSVASLYYAQPMLGAMGASLGASDASIGLVPTLTQLGYAAGIALLAPLGDRFERRRIILVKSLLLGAALLAAGLAGQLPGVLLASLLVGLMATVAQDVVPAAATLAPVATRGKTVGTVMTGLLMGILLSRVVSGVLAENFGWRSMFVVASVAIAAIGVAVWRGLPRFAPTTQLSYGALMASLGTLFLRHAALRRAALAQALLSVSFSAFWSTLAVMLHSEPFHLGSAAAGAFGLAGAAGALAAPLAGRLADRKGPELVTRLGALIAMLSFAAMAVLPGLSPHGQIALIVLAAIGFDLGVQATLIAHQTIVFGIEPAARSRLNAVLFVSVFIGMSAGSALGSVVLARHGWMGVTVMATVSAACALVVRMWPGARRAV